MTHHYWRQFSILPSINYDKCRCSNQSPHQDWPSTTRSKQNQGTHCWHASAGDLAGHILWDCGVRFMVPFSSKLRELGVTLDEKWTFDDHISRIVQVCNYHLFALRHIRPLVDQDIACSRVRCVRMFTVSRFWYYAWDWITAMLFYMEPRSKTLAISSVSRICSCALCLAPYKSSASCLHRRLHWLQYRNE